MRLGGIRLQHNDNQKAVRPQHDNNQKANGEPWKSRMSHIRVLKKKCVEKMNSSKQCDLDKSANNNVDDMTHRQQKSQQGTAEKKKAPYWGIEKIVKYHVRYIDETNLHSKMCLLYK